MYRAMGILDGRMSNFSRFSLSRDHKRGSHRVVIDLSQCHIKHAQDTVCMRYRNDTDKAGYTLFKNGIESHDKGCNFYQEESK